MSLICYWLASARMHMFCSMDFILFCVLCVVACVHKLMQNVVWCIYTFFKQSVLPIYYCLDIYHTALVSFAFDLFRRRYFFLSRARSMAKCLGFVFIIRSPQLMSVPQCVYGMQLNVFSSSPLRIEIDYSSFIFAKKK